MARKTRRSHRKGTRKATRRMRGGFIQLNPADLNDTSMNSSSSLQLKQGAEYLSAHAGQHGGSRFRHRMRGGQNAPPPAMNGQMPVLSQAPAMAGGQNAVPPTMNGQMPVLSQAPAMAGGQDAVPPTMNGQMPVLSQAPAMAGGQNVSPPPMVMNAAPVMTGGMAPINDTGMLDASLRGFARVTSIDQANGEIVGMKDQSGGRRRRKGKKSRKSRKSRKGRKGCKSSRRMKGGSAPVDSPTMMLPTDMLKQAVMGMNPEWKLAENPASFTPTTPTTPTK